MKLSVLLSGSFLICCLCGLLFYDPPKATSSGVRSKNKLPAKPKKLLEQELGQKLFFDPQLSNPVGQSCASCHAPGKGFADPQQRSISEGARAGLFGNRNSSTITYAAFTPPLHFDSTEAHYVGGFFWDGRASTLVEQAKGPLLNHLEMNGNKETIIKRLQQPEYQQLIAQVYGENQLTNSDATLNVLGQAIAAFESSAVFSPFTSKFDYYKQNKTTLTEEELQGLKLFNDPKKGNCAACHPTEPEPNSGKILFTDFTFDNLGLPVNPEIVKRLNGNYQPDLGLGAVVNKAEEYGKFKVPTLRNVAVTAPYFHNGVFKTLEETVQFYNQRDTGKFGPPEIPENVNHEELGNLNLTDQEVKAIVAFMKTLTDGYQPEKR